MVKSAMVAVVLLGMTTQASADRGIWKSVFVGSMTLAAGGGYLLWDGVGDVRDAEQKLCEGGVAAGSCTPSSGPPITITPQRYDALVAQGEWGATQSRIGALSVLVGLGVGGFAFYKGFVEDDDKEPSLIVAPAITPTGGGATLQLRW